MAKLLVFSGSTRANSLNAKLAAAAAAIAQQQGADVTLINLADYPASIYNGDDETANGIPESIRQLKKIMAAHDGFIISSPEYNGHIPPLLSNTFSWASRAENDETGMVAYTGKKAAIMGASPGRLGGIRMLPRLRDTLAELGITVVPGFVTLPMATSAFADDGALTNEAAATSTHSLVQRLIASCNA
ncbi:hypothetical protein AB833_01165 [Chromatiales bacterium (ex Bugula neritina AB1)]|nr:hypothetical protein AB833_01165 [Chromatiales bacterium (ex Bugula neritina AB1)]